MQQPIVCWWAGYLFLAAVRMLMVNQKPRVIKQPDADIILLLGAVLGFASGLTGIGGGVFLSPILLIFGWCSMRQSTAVAAGFILLNSYRWLAGYLVSDQLWPTGQAGWLIAALLWLPVGCASWHPIGPHLLHLQKLLAAGAGILPH